ncbi:hypothetical protein J6590_043476, partial [Homalodisca vitripennis]
SLLGRAESTFPEKVRPARDGRSAISTDQRTDLREKAARTVSVPDNGSNEAQHKGGFQLEEMEDDSRQHPSGHLTTVEGRLD